MRSAARIEAMASMYRAGKTLAEIGAVFGISRERVRQLIKRGNGGRKLNGGSAEKARISREKRSLERQRKFLKAKGCTEEQYRDLQRINKEYLANGYSRERSPIGAYACQRVAARRRGVEWDITLWDWWNVWVASGKWGQRGRDGYVMCRFGDTGAYRVGNVYVATISHNSSVQPNNPHRRNSAAKIALRNISTTSEEVSA